MTEQTQTPKAKKAESKMPMLEADSSNATVFAAFPRDWYSVRLENGATDPYGLDKTKKGTGLMAVCNLVIETGELADRRVFPPYRVLVGGNKEDGRPHDMGRCYQLINATRIEWTCSKCAFVGGNGMDIKEDTKRFKWLCPNCDQESTFKFNSDHFWGKRIKVLLGQEKGLNSDAMVNSVERLAPLS